MNEALGMIREVRMREVKGARAMGTGKPNMGMVGEGDHWATTVIHPNTTLVRHQASNTISGAARHGTARHTHISGRYSWVPGIANGERVSVVLLVEACDEDVVE
jgi:hypothetical protein